MKRGRPSYIYQARSQVIRHFELQRERVFTPDNLVRIIDQYRDVWRLPLRMSGAKFIEFLKVNGELREIVLKRGEESITRYSWGEVSPYEVAQTFKTEAFLSHASAAYVHGLTDVVQKRVFVNVEQSPKPGSRGSLSQRSIDLAFSRPQRQSTVEYEWGDYRIVLLNGKHSGRFEVGRVEREGRDLKTTMLERTLVDLTVRPLYAGGVPEVLEAYRRAREEVSMMRLLAVLKRFQYVYPYHQAIGFYMERAGFKSSQFEQLRQMGFEFDFYLAHGMPEKEYDSNWRLYIPKGL